ncbi:MAG: transposase [Frankiaceae bacterium]
MRRFPSRHHFATCTGTAPLEVSSGEVQRHRLSRAGNRRLNHALHIVAMAHQRHDERGRAYHARKLAAGKGRKRALRCLKRRLADAVFRRLVDDATTREAGPGRHSGAATKSSAAGQPRRPALRTSHFPDPPNRTLLQPSPARLDTEGGRYLADPAQSRQ